MTAIKICGVKDQATYNLLAELGVDWAGFVFYPPSPRYVSPEQIKFLLSHKNHEPKRVGLFVKPSFDDIQCVIDQIDLDILQLYTTAEDAEIIRDKFKLPVWLAKGIKSSADLPNGGSVDGFVVEAPSDKSDSRPGGNGRSFDWKLTADWTSPKPWILAGGLTPSNVLKAIQHSGAQAVDVSSGVERYKGEKDPALIREFVETIRNIRS